MSKDKLICPHCGIGELIKGEDKIFKCQDSECGRCYPPSYFVSAKKKATADSKAKG